MSDPQRVLIDAATAAMREAGRSLRERGWPMELLVEHIPETDGYAVCLRFEVPFIPRPMEMPARGVSGE
jgi:hypothetical protein